MTKPTLALVGDLSASSLSPARVALAQHLRLIEGATAVAAQALVPCLKLRLVIDNERQAQQTLKALVDEEDNELDLWATGGPEGPPPKRRANVLAAEAQLAEARRVADGARQVLPKLEESRNGADIAVQRLIEAAKPLVYAVILEEADAIAEKGRDALRIWIETYTVLNSLDLLLRGQAGVNSTALVGPSIAAGMSGYGSDLAFRTFDLPALRFDAWRAELQRGPQHGDTVLHARRWSEFAAALLVDASKLAPETNK